MKLTKMIFKSMFFMLFMITIGCSDDDDDDYGNWIESSDFDGDARANAVSFVIGNKGYLATGYDGDDYLVDVWEYSAEGNYWVQKADFPGTARSGAVGFELNGVGYLGTGYDGDDKLNDFWAYDATTNTWEPRADFIGTERYGAIGFSVSGNGYIGTGYDGSELKDFYKYNDVADSWGQSVGYSGSKRKDAATFTIGNKVYLGTGIHNGIYEEDFYVFDGDTEVWTKLTDLDEEDEYSITRSGSVGFTLDGKGYYVSGNYTQDVWEYDPSDDTWDELASFEGSGREDASGFNFGDRAFITMGKSGSYYFDDIWEFKPLEEVDEDD